MTVRIICDCAELAMECLEGARRIGFAAEPEVAADPFEAAQNAAAGSEAPIGLALVGAPTLDRLVELSDVVRGKPSPFVIAILERSRQADRLRDVAMDLGMPAVRELGALLAATRLLEANVQHPWGASLRGLPGPDRARLRPAQAHGGRSAGQLVTTAPGSIAYRADPERTDADLALGHGSDVADALAALRDTDRATPRVESSVDSVDHKAVLDVLFGPRRALSDPASKTALVPYGIPVPLEELCASASRAASEAGRIGFPVRISLASPDLRVWDHADLAVDMVDNAARVRDTFRQLMGLAKAKLPHAAPADPLADSRLLGVMVTATSESIALLGVRAWPLPNGRVAMELGFADAHGFAADDRTLLVMPAAQSSIERAVRRLGASSLLLSTRSAQRRAHLDAIADVLLRLSAFVHDRRREVSSVELRPVAVLVDGSVEVREACVTVSDAFERSLHSPPLAGGLGR